MKYLKAKKIAALLLAGMIVLVGCGAKEQSTNEQSPNVTMENQQKTEESKKPEEKPEDKKEEKTEDKTEEKKEEKSESAKTEDKKQEPEKEEKKEAKKEEVKKEAPKKDVKKEEAKKEETKKEEPKKEEKKENSKPASKYKDGTYSGTAKGYEGNITVSLTIQGDKITALSVTESGDDPEYLNDAKAVINSILNAQSTGVDSVSGATFTSNGIKAAAQSALDKATN